MSDPMIPYSREAEQGVLGAMLSDPIKYADDAIRRLRDDHFYCSDTRTLFVKLRDMADASRIIEPVNVVNWLREQNELENVTAAFVTELATGYTTLLGFDQWCDTLTDRLARRTIIAAAQESKTLAMDMSRSWKEAMQAADSEMSLLQVLEQSNQAVSMATVMNETIEDLDQAMKNKGKIRGVKTGLPDLDRTINGLEAPDLFVIGARPGMGKTNLLLRLMESMTFAMLNEQQVPTLMFSLEMGRMQVGRRVLFSAADVEQSKGKTGFLSKDDEANVSTSAMKWQKTKVWVDDTPELTIADIRARIRAAKRKWGIRVVMIDYISNHRSGDQGRQTRRAAGHQGSRGRAEGSGQAV
jgi:replicative DNA helicase